MKAGTGLLCLLLTATPALAGEADAVLAQILADEAGHWEGDCVERTPEGLTRRVAVFDIVADGAGAHRFHGRYGETTLTGRSTVAGGERVDHLEGAAAPTRTRIQSARRYAADDYHYVLRDDAGRTTVVRMGPRQLLRVDPRDAPDRPARLCSYLLTGPAQR